MSVPLVPRNASSNETSSQPPRRKVSRREVWVILALFAGLMLVFPVLKLLLYSKGVAPAHLPRIVTADVVAAQETWRKKGLLDYNLEAHTVTDTTQSSIRIEVRGGQPTRLLRDGREEFRESERQQWTVDGQLERIGEHVAIDATGAGGRPGNTMHMVAKFDPDWGYAVEFSRQGTGDARKFYTRVTHFEPLPGSSSQAQP